MRRPVAFCVLTAVLAGSAHAEHPLAARGAIDLLDPAYGASCDGSGRNDLAAWTAAVAEANRRGNVKIVVPGEPRRHICVLDGPIPPISAHGVYVEGTPYVSQIVETADADLLTWRADQPGKDLYGGGVSGVWLRRTTDTNDGAGLTLHRVNGFFATRIDVRDFKTDIAIEGGSGLHFDGLNATAGQYFAGFKSGSALVRFLAAEDGSGWQAPGEMTLSNYDLKGAANNFLDKAVIMEAADGVYFGAGHLGFAATAQLYLSPTRDKTNIQSVHLTGAQIDGNNTGGRGLWIPPLTVAGSLIDDISVQGGGIEDLTGAAVEVAEPSARVRIATNIRNIGGWGVLNTASAAMMVSGLMDNVGASGFGAIATGNAGLNAYGPLVISRGKPGQTCIPKATGAGAIHLGLVVTQGCS